MKPKFKKGQTVHYPIVENRLVQAIVRTAHKDGTFTVEAQHVINAEGKYEGGGYLGYRYRMPAFRLRAA